MNPAPIVKSIIDMYMVLVPKSGLSYRYAEFFSREQYTGFSLRLRQVHNKLVCGHVTCRLFSYDVVLLYSLIMCFWY